MNIKTFTTKEQFIEASTQYILQACQNNPTKIALSGGTTPKPIYKKLSKNIPPNTEFYQVDERRVPKDHPDSNYKMITKYLPLKHFFDPDEASKFNIPPGKQKELNKVVKKYEEEIKNTTFDLTILGIGPDGHTASLFPYSPALETKKTVASTFTLRFRVKDRLTITFPKILESKKILILLKGPEKKEIIEELTNPTKTSEKFPAKKLLDHKDLNIYFCSE